MKTIEIYCTYHKSEQKDFIKEDWLIPYNVSVVSNGINSLNPYLCEYVTMYYVWKKRPVDRVGFCHYRRRFMRSDIKQNGLVLWYIGKSTIRKAFGSVASVFLLKDLIQYVENNYSINSYEYTLFHDIDTTKNFSMRECYICDWKIFDRMMDFIDGWICYIKTKYRISDTNEGWNEFVSNTWECNDEPLMHTHSADLWFGGEKDVVKHPQQFRVIAYLLEYTIGVFLANYDCYKVNLNKPRK